MKFWKKLAVGLTALVMCLTLTACGKNDMDVSKDLDGDGVISEWETVFDKVGASSRVIQAKDIQMISSFSELKAINDRTDESKVYMLSKSIDCGGEEVNIDLGTSVLYGNNKVIKNFKLAKHNYTYGTDENISDAKVNVYGLIFNGVGIYDLRIFMGMQTINLDDYECDKTIVAPIINSANVDTTTIKGKIEVNRNRPAGLSAQNYVDVALGVSDLKLVENQINEKNNDVYVRNITIYGEIDYNEEDANTKVTLGGIMPRLNANSILYNADAHVNIYAENSGEMIIGGLVGENNDLVTCGRSDGLIDATYAPNYLSRIGGLVGYNTASAEIKDSISGGIVKFDADPSVASSKNSEMHVGGVTGRNLGVIDYVENSAQVTISHVKTLNVGGVCGSSENGIFSNVLNSAKVKVLESNNVNVSEFCGITKYGLFEQIVDTSEISVVNSTTDSSVKLGMLTSFEYAEGSMSEAKYNADYSPYFNGILMAGGVSITTKPVDNRNSFVYNLGLRNTYEYYRLDENGNTIPVIDDEGNQTVDDNNNPIFETATRVPDVYAKLYKLDNYSVKKYTQKGENVTPDNLKLTYAKGENNADLISTLSQSRLLVKLFISDLGFKYGLNHNELNLTSDTNEIDITKLHFTYENVDHLTKFYEGKNYNGELTIFDKYFDKKCSFNENDEMYSFLNALILSDIVDNSSSQTDKSMSGKIEMFTPLKISMNFIKSVESNVEGEEEESGEILNSLPYNFAVNVAKLLKLLFGVDPEIRELAIDKNVVDGAETTSVRYEQLEISDSSARYLFTFDVSQIPYEMDSVGDYIVYFRYIKVSK